MFLLCQPSFPPKQKKRLLVRLLLFLLWCYFGPIPQGRGRFPWWLINPWFGYFCMVLPRTLQIGYLHVWLYFFLISSLTGWGIPYISTSLLSGAARAKPFFHSHLVPWSSTYGKDQDHRGGGNKLFGTDTHLFESNLSRMIASKHLVPCFVTWLLRPLKEKKHTWRAHRE